MNPSLFWPGSSFHYGYGMRVFFIVALWLLQTCFTSVKLTIVSVRFGGFFIVRACIVVLLDFHTFVLICYRRKITKKVDFYLVAWYNEIRPTSHMGKVVLQGIMNSRNVIRFVFALRIRPTSTFDTIHFILPRS